MQGADQVRFHHLAKGRIVRLTESAILIGHDSGIANEQIERPVDTSSDLLDPREIREIHLNRPDHGASMS
jgi:hypothetical protein